MIAKSEKDYIIQGIENNIRTDSRQRLASRSVKIETGLIPQASGSAYVSVKGHGSSVLAFVNVSIENLQNMGDSNVLEETYSETGTVKTRVLSSAGAAGKFRDSKQLDNLCAEYTEFLNRILNGLQGGIDLKSLCIVPGALIWVISIDALILEFGGNLLDVLFLAVRGALFSTKMPQVTVDSFEGAFQYEVGQEETLPIPGKEDIPVSVTFIKVGRRYILDPTLQEELCADASLTICFNSKGQICSLKKSGMGGLEPALLSAILQAGQPVGQSLIKNMASALEAEDQRLASTEQEICPILR